MHLEQDSKGRRRPAWLGRGAIAAAIAGVAALEGAYGCVGEADTEEFIDENIGETREALSDDPGPSCGTPPATTPPGVGAGGTSTTCACDLYDLAACACPISQVSRSGAQLVAQANVQYWPRIDVFARVSAPAGWSLHVADSPTCNGWAGDGGTADHDAEVQLLDQRWDFYRATTSGEASVLPIGFDLTPDATVVRVSVIDRGSSSDGIVTIDDGVTRTITSSKGLRTTYAACASASDPGRGAGCDWENACLSDAHYWYLGLNRTVGSASRSGSGVLAACVVFSQDVSPGSVPASCLP